MNYIKFDPISIPMYFLLVIVVFTIIFLILIEPRIVKRKLTNKNEHGSSKFADSKEIEETFIKEDLNKTESVGFPVYYEKKNGKFENVYLDNKSPHFLLIGSTGSGKSVTVVIPECLMFATSKEKHSVVVTDPKAEIFKATGKVFYDNGYNVITIDFRNPNKSKRINIMQPIINEWKDYCKCNSNTLFLFAHFIKMNKIKVDEILDNNYITKIKEKYKLEDYLIDIIFTNIEEIKEMVNDNKLYKNSLFNDIKEDPTIDLKDYLKNKTNDELIYMIREYQNISSKHQAEANRLVISLADLIFVDKDTNDKFWINSAKQLFIGIVGIFLEDYQKGLISENKINLSSIKKFQNSSLIKENQQYLQKNINNRKYGSLSKDYLNSILSAAENTYKSITTVFGEKMAIFDDLNVENITSTNEFDFIDLGKKPTALFIIVPDEDRSYFQLVTIIIGMLTKDLTKFANLPENNGMLPVKVEWLLDEFANCPPLSSIETLVSVARSRGMRFQFFIQSFSQLNQVYGKEVASIIQDNAALVYLKTNTVETAEIISKKLGKATIETNSLSKSTDVMKIGANQTTSLMGKDLLSVTEIISLKYKTIIFPTVSNPIFRDTYLYSDLYPKYSKVEILERKTSILKRMVSNYYTVEELKLKYEEQNQLILKNITNKEEIDFKKSINKKIKKVVSENNKVNNELINIILMENLSIYKPKTSNLNGFCTMNMNQLIKEKTIKNLKKLDKGNNIISISKNLKKEKSKVCIWENIEERGK